MTPDIQGNEKLCSRCWGKIPENDLIIDSQTNEYLHPECARKDMEDKIENHCIVCLEHLTIEERLKGVCASCSLEMVQ